MSVNAKGSRIEYRSRRHGFSRASTSIAIEVGEPMRQQDLEIFLTARFRLYSFQFGRLVYADVNHRPWPLQSARALSIKQNLIQAAGLPAPEGAPLVHFSRGVSVRVSRPRILRY